MIKICNVSAKNMSTDIRLSKDQMTNFDKGVRQYYK